MIEVVLSETYFNQGFFNVRIEYSACLGEHNEPIVFQKDDETSILGYINRTANSNSTPRIMLGKEFTKWIQTNYSVGSILKVKIISKHYLKENL